MNCTANNNPGSSPNSPVDATHPNIGGIAPGKAPTNTAQGVIRLRGVYTATYKKSAKANITATEWFSNYMVLIKKKGIVN